MKRETIASVFFFALLAFVLYQVFLVLRPFIGAMFWAGIVTFACYPLHDQVCRRFPKWKESRCSLVSTTLIIVILLPVSIWVMITLTDQAFRFVETATTFVEEGGLRDAHEQLREIEIFASLEDKLLTRDFNRDPSEWALEALKGVGGLGSVASTLTSLTRNILVFFANFVLMVALVFFFFRDGKKITTFIYRVVPIEREQRDLIFQKIQETLAAVIRGQFINSLVQGILAAIIYWAVGVPLPAFFGFLTMIASFIPVTGAASIWFPWGLYFVVTGETVRGIILIAAGAIVISLVDNLLKPLLIGEKTEIPMLLLFLGILGGLEVYGLTGLFVAPILLSLMFVLVKQYRDRYPELLKD